MVLKLLLVDDNKTFVAAVRQFLDRMPQVAVVGQARDASTALACLADARPDVVLMDIAMPGTSGLELARQLVVQGGAPRIIFLSMHDNHAYRDAARDIGAAFVAKSEFVAELMPMLESLAAAHAAQTPMDGPAGPDGDSPCQ